MRPRKYHVELNEEEQKILEEIINKGKNSASKIKHAQILLKLDESNGKKAWTGSEIKEAYGVAERTISLLAKRFVENGLESALERQKQLNRHHKVTGEVEAQMIAIACSEAPEGYSKWTLQMIADKLVELKVIDSISATAVGTTLKKANLSLGSLKSGVSQKRDQNS